MGISDQGTINSYCQVGAESFYRIDYLVDICLCCCTRLCVKVIQEVGLTSTEQESNFEIWHKWLLLRFPNMYMYCSEMILPQQLKRSRQEKHIKKARKNCQLSIRFLFFNQISSNLFMKFWWILCCIPFIVNILHAHNASWPLILFQRTPW